MNVHLDFWQAVSLLITIVGAFAGGGKLLLFQIDKRLDLRFSTLEASGKEADRELRDILKAHIEAENMTAKQLLDLERQMLNWKAELPLQYVRREDFIRNQTIIESKLDGLALKIENAQLRGGNNVG